VLLKQFCELGDSRVGLLHRAPSSRRIGALTAISQPIREGAPVPDVKAWKATDPKLPDFPKSYEVDRVQDLSCTDIKGNNNKYYHLEVQVSKDGKHARVHSEYGRVGAAHPAREYRYGESKDDAIKIFDSIIKSKTQRKNEPYVKIDLASSNVGSK